MKIFIVFGLVAQFCFVLGTPTNPDETSFEHHVYPKHSILIQRKPPCNGIPFDTPICDDQCKSSRYSMKQQITHGHEADYKQIMYELMTHGPLEMVMNGHEEFITYESGVYFNAFGNELGKHAMRLIGWGEEEGTRYWTSVNSWNVGWGEKGFFHIVRGWNECQIESDVTAGMPKPFRRS